MDPATAFAVCLIIVGVALLLHHGYKHGNEVGDTLAKRESCWECCYFQLSDISNHETWILVCFTNAATVLIMNGICG
jgi:ribulose bisphosphate carboxylase small subunit